MSQRSHVANSGSSPIEACSAAWAAPGTSVLARASSTASAVTVHQTAWVGRVRSGNANGSSLITVLDCVLCLRKDTTWLCTLTVPNDIATGPHCSLRTVSVISTSVTDRAWVEYGGLSRCTTAVL